MPYSKSYICPQTKLSFSIHSILLMHVLVIIILCIHVPCEEIASTTCHMDQRSFFPEGEPRPHSKHHTNSLNKQGPGTQVAANDKPA